MNRRKFLSLSIKTGAAVAFACLAPVAAAYQLGITRREITLAGLPRAFDGYRVALLTDLHHSPWITRRHIRRAVNLANHERPDLVALTGDLIDRERALVPSCIQELSRLQGRDGVMAVLGNHDHSQNSAPAMRQAWRQAGIADLTNTNIALQRDGQTFLVGGVGDYWRERQKLHLAVRGARNRESTLLLCHNPDYVEEIRDERVGLVLSGHTHGGQVVLPWFGAPILPSKHGQKYRAGLVNGPVARVYVSCGVGSSMAVVRIGCPPEVVLLTLRSPARKNA